MLYKDSLKEEMLVILEDRIASISDCIQALIEEGYIPNRKKEITLEWSSLLIHAYENIDILSEEQQQKIDNIFNKIMMQ